MKGPGGNKCKCELMSVDCLDSIRCIRHDRERNTAIALGVLTRKVIKEVAKFRGKAYPYGKKPLGKATQYATIDSWRDWTKNNVLPERYGSSPEAFINHTLYAYCADHKVVGKLCFFRDLGKEEDLDTLEVEALEEYSASLSRDSRATIAHNVRADLLLFLSHSNTENSRNKLPALGLLMSFVHIARIHYNRQQPMIETYEKHFKTISPPNITSSLGSNQLRVSMHLRRADSCDHEKNDFLTKASSLDSVAQHSMARVCYATSVYVDALLRVIKRAGNMPVEVYLSTDFAGSVLDEIKHKFKSVYNQVTWHYLDFPRDVFDYEGYIEYENEKRAILGETAAADLWHLSHGQVFIGHLGSRFGKVGWILATARYNSFIPFFTVDGHSFCCEIDEQCHDMKPYIRTLNDCMTFRHELHELDMNEDYWKVGSLVRKMEHDLKHERKIK